MVQMVAISHSVFSGDENAKSTKMEIEIARRISPKDILKELATTHAIRSKSMPVETLYSKIEQIPENITEKKTLSLADNKINIEITPQPFTDAVPPLKAGAVDGVEKAPLTALEFKDLVAFGINKVDPSLIKYLLRLDPQVTSIVLNSPAGQTQVILFQVPPEYYLLKTIELISSSDDLLYDLNYFNTVTTKVRNQEVLVLASLRDYDKNEITSLLKTLGENTPFSEIPQAKECADWLTSIDPEKYNKEFLQAGFAITEKGLVWGFVPEEFSEAPTSESLVPPQIADRIVEVTDKLRAMELPYTIMPSLDGRFYIRLWSINIVIDESTINISYSEERDRCLAEKLKKELA